MSLKSFFVWRSRANDSNFKVLKVFKSHILYLRDEWSANIDHLSAINVCAHVFNLSQEMLESRFLKYLKVLERDLGFSL
jgi:hypothetical protein